MKIRTSIFKRSISFLLLIFITLIFQFCKSSKNATTNREDVTIFYTKSIAPILERSCTPCHFPEKGKKKLLNNYEAVKNNIADILIRVQLPVTDKKYMPFKSKKPPLTEEEVNLLKTWYAQSMPE